ncbi:MAG TPA: 4Fe-4S dicluster domain-containing protein [Proteobacteria bacterium]|nr:4Fe-4S dicluster domain-containing protein [Pseudomonadota bacterium]
MEEKKGSVKIKIDGKEIEVPYRSTILEAANKLGIEIPTLCRHPALSTIGACRVCLVKVKFPWGRERIVTACNFPIEDEIEVYTDSEDVIRDRKIIIELLLARSSNVPIIQELARKYGIEEPRFPKEEEGCILCGLCVRVCEEAIGARAIDFVGRGVHEMVAPPFGVQSETCIGCGACASVCPTGYIQVVDKDGKRYIEVWNAEFELALCKECGKPITTKKHIEYLKEKIDLPDYIFELCDECKRKFYAERIAVLGHM